MAEENEADGSFVICGFAGRVVRGYRNRQRQRQQCGGRERGWAGYQTRSNVPLGR